MAWQGPRGGSAGCPDLRPTDGLGVVGPRQRSAPTCRGGRPCPPRRALARAQAGQALPLAIILLAVAALVASPVLILVSTMLLGQLRAEDNTRALLAAEAGLEAVLADLVRGAEAVTTTYPIPTVSVNGFTPTIAIATPTAQATPYPTYQYHDPGLQDPDFAVVPPQRGYLIHLYNVQPSSATFTNVLNVNWAFSPAGPTRIGVWFNEVAYRPAGRTNQWFMEQPILDTGRSRGVDSFNQTGQITLGTTPGVYSILFFNASEAQTVTITPFKPSGGTGETWVYATAFKDFVITSTVGGTAVEAYVRQSPGFMRPPVGDWSRTNTSFVTQTLTVQTLQRP